MAALTGRRRVAPTPATALPGDEPLDLDPAAPEAPTLEVGSGGRVRVDFHGATPRSVRARATAIATTPAGSRIVESVVDGWRFELEVEDATRAELRRRATRARDAGPASGPTEIRAIIPGRVAAVRVAPGDVVAAGASLLVVEAMKMQNELRTPRDGVVDRIAVAEGQTIDPGDLLVVIR